MGFENKLLNSGFNLTDAYKIKKSTLELIFKNKINLNSNNQILNKLAIPYLLTTKNKQKFKIFLQRFKIIKINDIKMEFEKIKIIIYNIITKKLRILNPTTKK